MGICVLVTHFLVNKKMNLLYRHIYKYCLFDIVKILNLLIDTGQLLDSLARTALWDAGLDYLHGTGHGVGAFLNVHEGIYMLYCV